MFNVIVSQEQGKVPVTVIRIEGSFNLGTASQVDQAIQTAYANGARDMLLDLSETSAMTSAGLRSIVAAYKLVETPHLKLLQPSSKVSEVLQLSGLNAFLDVYGSLPDAIASFGE